MENMEDSINDVRGTKRKAEEKQQQTSIEIKVKSQWDNLEIFFKLGVNIRLNKVIHAFCDKRGIDYRHYHFLYNGTRLDTMKTPNSLQMEDDDEILAFLPADGGGCKGFYCL